MPDGEWYLHLFAPEQPDFDWENPEVVEEFEDILRFWLDRGVDGFRIDVANALKKDQAFPDVGREDEAVLVPHEGPHHPFWDRDEVHEVYRGWREVRDAYAGDRDVRRRGLGRRPGPARAATSGRTSCTRPSTSTSCGPPGTPTSCGATIDAAGRQPRAVGAPTTWVLSNHDVTRHATRYARLDRPAAGSPTSERVRPDTPLDPELGLRRARAAALLLLGLPGSAYVYQGEELGLPEVVDLPEEVLADPIWERSGHTVRGRDGCRVPIPWTPDGPSLGLRHRASRGCRSRPTGPSCRCEAQTGVRRLDARALPQRAPAAPRAARAARTWSGWTARRARWSSGGATPAALRSSALVNLGRAAVAAAGVRRGAARQRAARRRPPQRCRATRRSGCG